MSKPNDLSKLFRGRKGRHEVISRIGEDNGEDYSELPPSPPQANPDPQQVPTASAIQKTAEVIELPKPTPKPQAAPAPVPPPPPPKKRRVW